MMGTNLARQHDLDKGMILRVADVCKVPHTLL